MSGRNENEKILGKDQIYLLIFLFLVLIFIDLISKLDFTILNVIFHFKFSNYNYLDPPIYFSIGEAIAAIGLIFAIYQLRRGTWLIALEVRKQVKIVVGIFLLFGLLCVFIASIIPQTIKEAPDTILQIALLWEILAGISLICAPVFLFLGVRSKNLFKDNTAAALFSSLLRRVASKSSEDLDAVVDVLIYNLKSIVEKLPSQYIIRRENALDEIQEYAHHIINIIVSDPVLTEHVVVSRADFFQFFLNLIKKHNLYSSYASIDIAFGSLMKSAFENKRSYLYREIEFSGMGIHRPFLNDIFFDQRIFLYLNPFENFGVMYDRCVDQEKLELFITAFKLAIKGYWHDDNSVYNSYRYSTFEKAFKKLENIVSQIIQESNFSDNEKDKGDFINKMVKIDFFLGHFFIYEYKEALKKSKVGQRDLEVQVERKSFGIYPASLTSNYVQSVYNFLCIINDLKDKESIRHYAMSVADHLIKFGEPAFSKMREFLLELIWNQIEENIKGFYPLVLPSYLSLIGMWQDSANQQRKEEYNKVVNLLNKRIKPFMLKKIEMANDVLMEKVLLPPEIKFNKSKKLFEWQMHKAVQVMKIRK